MATPISAFALHIWEDCNRSKLGGDMKRKIAAIELLSKTLPFDKITSMLQSLMDGYCSENSSKYIHAMTHQGSFAAKTEFLGELPGM